ncbi:ketopantoate reductase family protein [Halobacterium sp. CBA1126]|uniref:ketopantoate reductase family protein n=1 Tax=Halobacterium sp. CBA1126 TaxID=2668074 RepID=UPI0012F8D5E0|nr:ketopantoate reductase family protein [Halobacterium sp. CBA1126]MUV60886.1 2-dehydropantoate 2-reductase [Halobacterium sp. CBA1126]
MRVVVLGAGSLGSLLAGALERTDADVTLLGRESDHVRRVRADGLRLTRPDGSEDAVPVDVATDEGVTEDADLLVVCVKSYDTADAMAGVAPHLDGADVLTLQNGLGNAETVADYVPRERVLAGTTTHGAVLEAPGHVRHAGRGDTTVGRYFAANDARVDAVADCLTGAGIETTVADDPEAAVWTKVLVNAGINAATALARVPNGALVDSESGERVLRRAVTEGVAVARAEGVAVPEDAVERTREVAERTASNRSSMRQDVERGRPTEVEALNGALVRRGESHGVETPVNETLADLVRLAEEG